MQNSLPGFSSHFHCRALLSWKIKIDSSQHLSGNICPPGVLKLHHSALGMFGCIPVAPQSCSGCLGVGLGWVLDWDWSSVYILGWLWTLWDHKCLSFQTHILAIMYLQELFI